MLNKQCKTKMESEILDAVDLLRQMQGTFTPHLMYLSKSYRLLSTRVELEDHFDPSWLDAYDQLTELLHALTVIYHEHSPRPPESELRRQMRKMALPTAASALHVEVVYRIPTADPESVRRLISEVSSITGMEPARVYDSSGEPVPMD